MQGLNTESQRSAATATGQFEFLAGSSPEALRIIFHGFWDQDTVKRYQMALQGRSAAAGGASPVRRVLLDLQDCTVQSKCVVDSQADIIQAYAGQIDEYGMLLPESSLLRVQMKRLMLPTKIAYFDSEQEALAWLNKEPQL
ncbi:MAG: hypothetical protein R3E11_02160 [Sphingobium sp.]|nr:hypothetical protein [Sphingobium sp.]